MKLNYIIISLILVSLTSYSQEVELVREYTYEASDHDSKISSREKAIYALKSLAIEEIGSMVLSLQNYRAEEENFNFKDYYKSKTKVLASAITRLRIIEENWTGKEYYLKAAIQLDQNEIREKFDDLVQKFLENSEQVRSYPKWLNAIMNKEVHPGEGIGELQVGMNKAAVVKLLGNPIERKTENHVNKKGISFSSAKFYYRYKGIRLIVGFLVDADVVNLISYSESSWDDHTIINVSPVFYGLKIGSRINQMQNVLGQAEKKEVYENDLVVFHKYNGVSIGEDTTIKQIYCFQITQVD